MSFPSWPWTDRPASGPRPALALLVAMAVLPGAPGQAGEVADGLVTLEATGATVAGQVPSALPMRFVLLSDGAIFVGGTSRLLAGRLTKDEMADLERRVGEVRKLPGLGSTVSFGPGAAGFRLGLRKGKPVEVLVQGDPASAPPALAPLSSLITRLLRFDHASLRPYEPGSYALGAREGKLVGGCRGWTLPVPLAEALVGPRIVPAAAVAGWPTGATPAVVCSGDKSYVVTLRPLVPGEKP